MSKVKLANGNKTIEIIVSEDGTKVDYRSPEFANQKPKVFVELNKAQEMTLDFPGFNAGEKEIKAYNKRYVEAMRQVMREAGFDTDEWGFSRKAGCACGCSPGFVYKGEEWLRFGDAYVTQCNKVENV